MKKWLSLYLALCMAFTLAAPALAEGVLMEAPLAEAEAPAEAPLLDVETPPEEIGQTALEEEPKGSSLVSPVNISVNQWVDGYTAHNDQVDYYRFTLPQDGVVSFSFRHTPEPNNYSFWYVSLDSDAVFNNNNLYQSNAITLQSSAETTTSKIGLSAGTYYIQIAPAFYNSPTGHSYSVRANYMVSSQWETEGNDMLDSADSIQAGRIYYGSTSGPGDDDYFKFTLSQRDKVTLTFNHTRENATQSWYVAIGYNKNGSFTSVVEKLVYLDSEASVSLSATLSPGTYYILFDPGISSITPVGREYNFVLHAPKEEAVINSNIRGFVTRLYDKCLGRQPDASGMNTWVGVLADGSWTAERVAWGFVFSKEYINKHTSNDAYVRMLYRVYMDREADSSGYNTWINALNSGWSREQVMQGFSRSVEFKNICARYGMTPW